MNNAVFPIVLEAPSIALNYLSIKFLFLDITEKLALPIKSCVIHFDR